MNKWSGESWSKINESSLKEEAHGFLVWVESKLPNSKITETKRLAATQQKYFKEGTSKCDGIKVLSKHQIDPKTGKVLAFDIVPFPNLWNSTTEEWLDLHLAIEKYWREYEILMGFDFTLVWGGDWKKSITTGLGWDKPHYELILKADNK
ncbi:MAG: hypothetical protein ACRC0V_03835 [Fusobacteriaceae bacterium]